MIGGLEVFAQPQRIVNGGMNVPARHGISNPEQLEASCVSTQRLRSCVEQRIHIGNTARTDLDETTLNSLAESVLEVYQGPFLKDETEQPCYLAFREHLRGKFMRVVGKLARYWEEREEWERAFDYYERGVDADNLSEGFYRHMMLCLQALGREAEAVEVYERLRAVLSASLKLSPSAETNGVLERIVK